MYIVMVTVKWKSLKMKSLMNDERARLCIVGSRMVLSSASDSDMVR